MEDMRMEQPREGLIRQELMQMQYRRRPCMNIDVQ